MSGVFKPCLDILPPAQRRLWPELGRTGELGFALYGGTAIALRLGHRSSVDFDFFSEKPLDHDAIQAAFPFMALSTVLQDERNTVSVLVPYGDSEHSHIKVSFFGTIDFGRVGEPEMTEDGVLQVASLDDLMATKVKVVLQRAEAKDYRDIVAMLSADVSLPRGLAAARAMYGLNFQPSESLKAMVYFEDGDLRTLTTEEKNTLVKAVGAVRELPQVDILSKQLIVADCTVSDRIGAARQAPIEQAYQAALAMYVQAKHAQVERIEVWLENLIERQQTKHQQIQATPPGLFSLPGARRAWQKQQAQQQARLQTLRTRLAAVREMKHGMGLDAPKLEELATRKLRAQHPKLAAEGDAQREAVRRQQLRMSKPEQGREEAEPRERQARGKTLGRRRPP